MSRFRSFAWFQDRKRPPSEYEEVTAFFSTWGIPFLPEQEGSPLAAKSAQPFLMNPDTTAIHEFFKPHTVLKSIYWEGFRDPHQIYYKTYNQMQWEAEAALDRVLNTAEEVGHFDRLPRAYRDMLEATWPPLRFLEWAVVKAMQEVAHYAPSSPVDQCATFQVADGLRFVQRNITFSMRLGLGRHKDRWLKDALWQPVRRLAERIMTIRDWVEAVVAANLGVQEGLLHGIFPAFTASAQAVGDFVFVHLLKELGADLQRHVDWAQALVDYLGQDPKYGEANRAQLTAWKEFWGSEAEDAFKLLRQALVGEEGVRG
jgi:toluene monooxygenase system protein E